MKKLIVLLAVLAAASTSSAYASPQTQFKKGQAEINAGMWDVKTDTDHYDSPSKWNFTGGLTYGINDRLGAQYQWTGLTTKHTNGNSNEINLIYSVHPQIALFGGWNRISMKDFPNRAFNDGDAVNNIAQFGVIARQPIAGGLDLYAKGGVGTESTSMWEAGLNYAMDKDLDVTAGYHYLNTRGDSDHNVTYKGFMAGLSYRFGGKDPEPASFSDTGEEDYDYEDETPSTVSVVDHSGPADISETPADTPVAAPENDYYYNTIHFDQGSSKIQNGQKSNLDDFVEAAKDTGHIFKVVGHPGNDGSVDHNRQLAQRRVQAVLDYATDHGIPSSQLSVMYKGTGSQNDNTDQVDIFEHK